MRHRGWLIVLVAIVCGALGVLIAGIPGNARDRPLSVRLQAVTPTTASTTTTTTTTSTTTTTVAPPPRPLASIAVRAVNASTVSLAATRMASRISALGYQTLPPANGNRTDLATTTIVYSAGFDREAGVLAQALGITQISANDPTLSCDPAPCTGDIIVFVGRDAT